MNPFESTENYMSAVWNENLSDSYTGQGYGYNKAVIFGSTGFFEEFRINNISPYKAILAFVELEKNIYEK